MDYSSEDSIGVDTDEITEVKRVLREAKARKRSLNVKLAMHSEKVASDRGDMQAAYKKQFGEIQRLTTLVNELELELRSARFEIGHSVLVETKKNEEISVLQCQHRSVVNELQAKLEEKDRIHSEQMAHVLHETEKLSGLLSSVHASVCDSSQYLEYKSCRQLLMTASKDAASLKAFVSQACNPGTTTRPTSDTQVVLAGVPSSSSSLDRTLMDMCRSLEEENSTLTSSMDQLKRRLAAAEEEIAKNNLIPHYRLAIVRARSYTANLLEQLKREQFTSESLREQLEATYADLRKMAEEKRSLYRKLSKHHLEADRQEHYPVEGEGGLGGAPLLNIDHYLRREGRGEGERSADNNYSSSSGSRGRNRGGGVSSPSNEGKQQQQRYPQNPYSLSDLDQEIADLQIKLTAHH